MQVKIRYLIVASLILIIAAFCCGWFAAGRSASKRIDQLEERAQSLETELSESAKRTGELTDGLRWSARANQELTGTIRSIAEENRRITEAIGNLGSGVGEDIKTISGLEERMGHYIEQATKQE